LIAILIIVGLLVAVVTTLRIAWLLIELVFNLVRLALSLLTLAVATVGLAWARLGGETLHQNVR
jgi:hypothetical protein